MKENIVDVFSLWFNSKMDNVHTIIPGEIISYEGHNQRKATVQPLVRLKTVKNKTVSIQPIDNVPVIFPSSKKAQMLFPLEKGDGVLLLFSEANIGNYLAGSGQQDADNNLRFQLTDCIAIPGLWSFPSVPIVIGANDNDYWIIYENGKIQIEKTTNNINLDTIGNINLLGATEAFIKGNQYVTDMTNFLTPISTITPGNEAANAAALGTIKTAAINLLNVLNAELSQRIKGE